MFCLAALCARPPHRKKLWAVKKKEMKGPEFFFFFLSTPFSSFI
jgi:hypothetical protein